MIDPKDIRGAGGGKGGKKGRAAQEAADTLRSRQIARVVDMLCEGEIEGLVGSYTSIVEAEKNIYFDGVPLRNELGQPNFDLDAFSWAFVPGVQSQPVIPAGGAVSSEIAVGQQVKYGNTGGGPVIRSITEDYIDACRITVSVPRLTEQNTSNGDLNGSSVKFAIDVQSNGGGFIEVMAPTITGKTNSEYQRSYEFDLPGTGPWDIRVRRLTLDATTSNISNELYWSTFTKIVKQPLSYPNTAMMGIVVDSALFNKIPSRSYRVKLLKVKVPSNYFPLTRSYTRNASTGADTGVEQDWNGQFYTAWTDNPAWCWYDLATETRYGLGDYIDVNSIDKWTLYAIARYCDELVPDGFGGEEPRFTCNLFINKREEAIKVLMNMASIFRGIVYWHTNTVFCSQDRPGDPVKIFTQANVEGGQFNYSGSSRQTRHTVAIVAWNDPDNQFKQALEYVEDRDGIIRFGVREKEVTAMGCTSRGQANRLGKWILLTEKEETETVTFKTGLEGCGVMPGEIILTSDSARSGDRVGGRIADISGVTVTLDSEVTLRVGENYTLSIVLPSGVIEDRAVAWGGAQNTTTHTITISSAFSSEPQKNSMWVLQTDSLLPELWRIVSVTEAGDNKIEITAIEHIPGKYAAIEQGLKLQPRKTSNIALVPGAVSNLVAQTDIKKLNAFDYTTRIMVSWTPPPSGAARYYVTWRRDKENYKTMPSEDPSFDIDDVAAGTFEISVKAENAIGMQGPSVSITHVIDESMVEPDVQNLRLDPNFTGKDCPITWDRLEWAIKYVVQVLDGTTVLREEPVIDNVYVYTYAKNVADGGPRRSITFQVKAYSWRGASANWAILPASNPAPAEPQGVSLEAGPGQVSVFAERPTDDDLAGMLVWMHTDSSVPATDGYLVYKGTDNAFVKTGLQAGLTMYFRVAFYDTFGTIGLNASSSLGATPLATGGIVIVTTLPADPEAVGGQTAVFLDVPDVELRGLYGWTGTEWRSTRDGGYLVERSVTADRINALTLSAISANMGTMTAGNFTLNAEGFIRGGAVTFDSGTGIWMGYDVDRYKFRAGTPGSSRMEWTGTAFNIYDSAGRLTISSGIVDYEMLANQPSSLGDLNGTEYSKLTGIQDGATRNVYKGAWASGVAYVVGDIVMLNGNGWVCISAHSSATGNQPPAAGTSNTWWTLHTVKGDPGLPGVNGTRTAILDMYKWSIDTPTTFPSGNSTYTWSTGQFTAPATTNGWSLVPPEPVSGSTLWLTRQLYSDQGTSTTSTVAWSSSVATPAGATGAQGPAGPAGTRTAFLELYQWAYDEPTLFPVGSSTYTWETGAFTAPATPNGWALTPGSAVTGATLWACSMRIANSDTTTTTDVTWDASTAYAIGAAGVNALTVIVTNESHAILANADGVIPSGNYTGSGTKIQVFEGTTALTAASLATVAGSFTIGTPVASPTSITVGTRSYSGTEATVGNHSALVADSVAITYPISVKRLDGTTASLSRVQTITRTKTGATGPQGASAKIAILTASSQIFQIPKSGPTNPASITLTAFGQNVTGSPTFTVESGTATLTGTGTTRSLAYADMSTDAVTIKITWDSQIDYITIVKVREGLDGDGQAGESAITVVVSNEAHTVPAESDGDVLDYTNSGTTIQVYEGSTLLNATSSNPPAAGAFTIGSPTRSPAALIIGGRSYNAQTATVAPHSSMTADSVVITYPIVVKRANGTVLNINKTQTITKSKTGIEGPAGPAGGGLVLNPTAGLAFTFTDGIAIPGTQSLTFTAELTGITGAVEWSTNPAVTLSGTGNTRTLSVGNFGTKKQVVITASVGGVKDTVTVVRLDQSTAQAGATKGADSSNLKSGSGVNSMFNGDFSHGLAGVYIGWNNIGAGHALGYNLPSYTVAGEGTPYMVYGGLFNPGMVMDLNLYNGPYGAHYPVIPGKRYEFYVYLNTHRCQAQITPYFWNAAGSPILHDVSSNMVQFQGSFNNISGMQRSHTFITAPADAVTMFIIIRAYGIGQSNPYVFFSRVYFGEAGPAQTEPSPWHPGKGIQQITLNNASTVIDNAALGSAQIGSIALTGSYSFRSSLATAHMAMDANNIRVIDPNGRLRVKLGNLDV